MPVVQGSDPPGSRDLAAQLSVVRRLLLSTPRVATGGSACLQQKVRFGPLVRPQRRALHSWTSTMSTAGGRRAPGAPVRIVRTRPAEDFNDSA